MSTVNVDELFTSWLRSQLPGVGVASERPGKIEERLPFVVIRRGGGGDLDQWLDNPVMDVDYHATPGSGRDWDAVTDLAQQVDALFRQQTPTIWRGVQFTMVRCNQAPIKVGDPNPALLRMAATYSFSLI